MSRFQIHDDLTAPDASMPVLRGALSTGGQLPNFLGVLAGSPAAIRAYARFRAELRRGTLRVSTLERQLQVSHPGVRLQQQLQAQRSGGRRERRGRTAGVDRSSGRARQFRGRGPRADRG